MKIKGEIIVEGSDQIRSLLKIVDKPVSFLGMVDPNKGILKIGNMQIEIENKILSFPYMVGSTVAPYIIYSLKKNKKAPLAIITISVDALLASGCAISDIPLLSLNQSDFDLIKKFNDRIITVNAKKGEVFIDEE